MDGVACEECKEPVGEFRIEEVIDNPDKVLCFDCFVKSMKQINSDHSEPCEVIIGRNPYKRG